MINLNFLGIDIPNWVLLPATFLIWATVLLGIKNIVFQIIHKFASGTKTKVDDVLVQALDMPLNLLIFTSGAAIVEQMMPMLGEAGNSELTNYFLIIFKATAIIAIVVFVDKLLNGLFDEYSQEVEVLKTSGGILRGLLRIVVVCLGLLILLDIF